MDFLVKYRYSLLAGFCAAGGSFLGKLPSFLSAKRLLLSTTEQSDTGLAYLKACLEFGLVHLLAFGLMLFCNVCNLRYFLKALQLTQQTLTATVFTAASNYVLSFVLGALVYQEPLSTLSIGGIILLLAGLWCLCDTTLYQKTTDITKKS